MPMMLVRLRLRPAARGAAAAPSAARRRVGFVTDAEGSLPFWEAQVARSTVLALDAASGRLELRDKGAHFVYGGDCFDKGAGDARLARALVDLKRRHPDRVFLLLGNRDVNKMRLRAELHPVRACVRARRRGAAPAD